jgi:hypothetical protein
MENISTFGNSCQSTLMKHLLLIILFFSTSYLNQAQVPNYVPTNGLVGWWPFNGNIYFNYYT